MLILPHIVSVKCSFKIYIFFGSASSSTDEGKSELLALLINLHVNKMKPRKFLSACHMAVDASWWEKNQKRTELLCFSSQDAATSSNRILVRCSFLVPQDVNLCIHMQSKIWGLGIPNSQGTRAVMWYITAQGNWVSSLEEGTVFSLGQTPV